jgi:hypothetical protein
MNSCTNVKVSEPDASHALCRNRQALAAPTDFVPSRAALQK